MQRRDGKRGWKGAVVFACLLGIFPCANASAAWVVELNMENVPNVIGMGVGALPDYRGSDDYTWGVAPSFRYTFEDKERFIQLVGNELSANLLDNERFHVGPLLNYTFGRDDDVDDPQVSRMQEIDDTIEVGAFADFVLMRSENLRDRFILGVKVFQDVGNESDGFRANINARYWKMVAKPVDINITVGAFYQDDDWSDHYFGVNADNVGTSGLPFFTADGGVNEYYLILGGVLYLSKNWIVGAGVRGSIIAGDPADSPIVDQCGDSTQWIGGIGIAYAFW